VEDVMRKLLAGLGFALVIGACAGGVVPGIMMAAPAPSADIDAALADVRRPAADTERDALRHPREILQFSGVQPGWRVADVGPGGGYYTRLFSVAVGPEGRVFAIDRPNQVGRTRPILEVAPLYPNVTVVQQGYQGWSVDEPLDAIFISQIYHDFHLSVLNIDVPRLNREMFAALKPGGVLVIIDHAAVDGAPTGTDGGSATHRIDQAQVVRELTAAGFVLEEESQVLRNPADNRTERVFEGDIRGRTDQFVLRFRKPA
jgi:predicted methyltransferase